LRWWRCSRASSCPETPPQWRRVSSTRARPRPAAPRRQHREPTGEGLHFPRTRGMLPLPPSTARAPSPNAVTRPFAIACASLVLHRGDG
jgi:hypothetical protein